MSSSEPGIMVRVAIIIGVLGVIATVSLEVVTIGGFRRGIAYAIAERIRKAHLPSPADAAKARAQRQIPVIDVAPSPLPAALPLLGSPGVDAFGYPKQYVDGGALRSLLWHERYADLTWYFDQYQQQFEADPKREYWPMDASDAFDSAQTALQPALDAWVQATPSSFAPDLARGTYRYAVAWAQRGSKWATETPDSDLAAMKEMQRLALIDLRQAVSLRPKLVAALRQEIRTLLLGGPIAERRAALGAAEHICPSCFQVRVAYIYSLTPRWGGTYEQMTQFAKSVQDPAYPKMAALLGYADKDRADMLIRDKHLDQALRLMDVVCKQYDHWEFLDQRAEILLWKKEPSAALPDLNRAMALRPGYPALLLRRATAYSMLSRWEEAGTDLLGALRADPTDETGRYHHPFIVKGLLDMAWRDANTGKRDEALRLLDLAAQLAPLDHNVQGARNSVVTGASNQDAPPEASVLVDAVKNSPDDFRAVQRLDYELAKQGGHFDQIVELWNDYLSRHPNDGQAYLERGGAYYHWGKRAEAGRDARKACELGINEGCARARQLTQ